jgi:hypothetical protein
MSALRWLSCSACLIALAGPAAAQDAAGTQLPDAAAPTAAATAAAKRGTLHVVQRGDTLWAISDQHLGTPWIWPSVWIDNEKIPNPHLIHPGDLIWISDGKMRRVTPEEAARLLSEQDAEPSSVPAAPAPSDATPGPAGDPFASLDVVEKSAERRLRFAGLDHAPFVTAEELEASGAVVGSHEPHYWLSQVDPIIVSLGEGRVHVGDRFSIYRVRRRVLHPETNRIVGYFVEVLGRSEVSEVHPETSFARVTHAYAEIEPGDRLMPYRSEPDAFVQATSDRAVAGTILAQLPHRSYSGEGDIVVLDQGVEAGVVSGRELVVYRAGRLAPDPLSGERLMTPDDEIGRVFVLKSEPASSVALVTQARTEIQPGDRFRNEP